MEEEQSPSNCQQNFPRYTNYPNHQRPQQDQIKQQNFYSENTQTISRTITQTKLPYVPQQAHIPIKVRNRRFKKLQELRQNQFFSEQSIKLRHPLLYYLFLGQYQFASTPSAKQESGSSNLFSSFLEKNLINLEYKELLSQQMTCEVEAILQIQKNKNQAQILQIKRIFSTHKPQTMSQHADNDWRTIRKAQNEMEIQNSKFDEIGELSNKIKTYSPSYQQIQLTKEKSSDLLRRDLTNCEKHSLSDPDLVSQFYDKIQNSKKLTSDQKQIQQQHLIQFCQELFLQGKLHYLQQIDYKQIDESNEYDDDEEQNRDLEEVFFNEIEGEVEQGNESYYTGIQDY